MTFRSLKDSYAGHVATPMSFKHNSYIVPMNKSLGFSSLTHGVSYNPTKYFGIEKAYSTTDNCTTFGYRACSSDTIQTVPVMYVDSIIRPKSTL